jgi:hypothetical protein
MTHGSVRGGRSTTGPLLLAVIFLAVLGAGAGFSLGSLAKSERTTATEPASSQPATSTLPDGTGGQQTNPGNTTTSGGTGNTNTNTNGGNTDPNSTQCPKHTVDLASYGTLNLAFYLHTAKSEVWICKAADGKLFYQGHSGRPGEELHERVNALYLETVEVEDNGYVATNTDRDNGHVTKYHVNSQRLIIEHVWNPSDNETQPAV